MAEKTGSLVLIIISDDEEDKIADVKKKNKERKTQKRRTSNSHSGVEVRTAEEKLRNDDECCILNFDPTCPPEMPSDQGQKFGEDDDISVISERGQVACRDFPHSRHLCVAYAFSQTAHEVHCSLCYCYICDAAAPCKYWIGTFGHCHASDQDSRWKKMRARRLTQESKAASQT